MKKNILTYLLTYLRNTTTTNNLTKLKIEGHTTQLIYNKDDWLKFKHILSFQGTNPNRLFWAVCEIILEQYDQKEHSLDKFLSEIELLAPKIDTEPEKVLKYLRSLSMDKVKELEEKIQRDYVYIRAITNGEIELDNYPQLWRKYHP